MHMNYHRHVSCDVYLNFDIYSKNRIGILYADPSIPLSRTALLIIKDSWTRCEWRDWKDKRRVAHSIRHNEIISFLEFNDGH